MSRPLKEINRKSFEGLCGLQCTIGEICAFFEVTDKTLSAWCKREYSLSFSEVFAQKKGIGKISLRRAQFRLAETSATMAIFLGKQFLDQSDKQSIEHSGAIKTGSFAIEVAADEQDSN